MPELRITLDYTSGVTQRTAIGRYIRQLIPALAALHTPHQYTLFTSVRPPADYRLPAESAFRRRVLPLGERIFKLGWQYARLPLPADLLTGRADLWHGLNGTLPPLLHGRAIVTVHDLAFLAQPDSINPSTVAYLNKAVPRAVRRADAVITISEYTRRNLIERLHIPAERVQIAYPGISPAFQRITDAMLLAATRYKFELQQPLILTVGTLEARKNLVRLVQAFDKIRRERGGPKMLAIAGPDGWGYEQVYEMVNQLGLKKEVRFLNYVSDLDLILLYSLADVVALPSLYEDFGLPVLEAMACGAPVICSNTGGLPEAAGNAALLVKPTDTDTLAATLLRLLRNPKLRALLSKKGQAQAAKFTWEACAQTHLKVYEEVGKAEELK